MMIQTALTSSAAYGAEQETREPASPTVSAHPQAGGRTVNDKINHDERQPGPDERR
jgi:hypothetical protein